MKPTRNQKKYNITSMSLPTDEESVGTLKEFRLICARDEWNFSEGVWHAIKEYTVRHGKGNPQQRLDIISKTGKAFRANAQKCYCGETAVAEITAKNGYEGFMCAEHLERNKLARLLKKVKMLETKK